VPACLLHVCSETLAVEGGNGFVDLRPASLLAWLAMRIDPRYGLALRNWTTS
jgi:hypothetical protein